MLEQSLRDQVKASAPVLKAHGIALTRHFYARLVTHNPELHEVFNQGHQRSGQQQQALTMAVARLCRAHRRAPGAEPVLERIAAKHVSLGIRKEHYAIVGRQDAARLVDLINGAAPASRTS